MPAKRKTKADKATEKFNTLYRIGKARTGLKDPEIATKFGITERTLRRHRQEPTELPLKEFAKLAVILQWTNDEAYDILSELM